MTNSVQAENALILAISVFRDVAGVAVVFERQELARHGDLHAVALGVRQALDLHVEIAGRHDAVAELLLDQRLPGRAVDHHQLVEAVDERVGRRHGRAGAAHWHLVEQDGLGVAQAEQLGRLGGLRLGELHLAEQRADQEHWRIAADLLADVFPAPALLALDIENFLGEPGTIHRFTPSGIVRTFAWHCRRCHAAAPWSSRPLRRLRAPGDAPRARIADRA